MNNKPIQEGFCYFTPDTGRFFIDTDSERIALNAGNPVFGKASTGASDGSTLVLGIGLAKNGDALIEDSRVKAVYVPAATADMSGIVTTGI